MISAKVILVDWQRLDDLAAGAFAIGAVADVLFVLVLAFIELALAATRGAEARYVRC